MTRKEIANEFLILAGTGAVKEAYAKHIASNFIHHNQYFEGSREALEHAMLEAHQTNPNISIEVKHCYEEGQTVVTHSKVVKKDMQIAVVHIFRFEKNMIVELWDLGQILLDNSPNANGAF